MCILLFPYKKPDNDLSLQRSSWRSWLFFLSAFASVLLLFSCQNQAAKLNEQSSGSPSVLAPSTPEPSKLPVHTLKPDSPRKAGSPARGLFWIDGPDTEVADTILASMSDEEILAQVFMVGWSSPDAQGPVMDWISTRGIGGVKVFGWNGGDVERLAHTLGVMQRTSLANRFSIPLLTATDQEGGWVRHIKDSTVVTPGNLAIGSSNLPGDAWESSHYIALELRAIGVNMNFAPTVDVYTNPDANVIGPRAFSEDPLKTSVFSSAAFHGQDATRVITTAKHFPGHGNAIGDSHGVLPVIQDSLDTIWNRELQPYRTLIPEGVPAILSGHLSFPNITGDPRPASLSSRMIKDLLRSRLKFNGVIITDDLYMGGAADFGKSQGWGLAEVVLQALRAGNDMVMLSQTPGSEDAIWQHSLAAYRSDPAFRQQIRASVRRVLLLKLAYLKPDDRVPFVPDQAALHEHLSTPEAVAYFRDQAYRAISIIANTHIPFKPHNNERVLFVGQDNDFLHIAASNYPGSTQFSFPYEPFYIADPAIKAQVEAMAGNYDWIVFCLANPNSLSVLRTLEPYGNKVIVMSTLTPVYLAKVPWVKSALAVYGQGRTSFEAGFDALKGRFVPTGTTPVNAR